MSRKLLLKDIQDLRAYEGERDAFRAHMIAVKERRRVAIGTLVTVMFENRDTMRLQIQEMLRAEKVMSDEGVLEELDAYNPMIPEVVRCASRYL